jgi:hypothetical protein
MRLGGRTCFVQARPLHWPGAGFVAATAARVSDRAACFTMFQTQPTSARRRYLTELLTFDPPHIRTFP